MFSFAWPSMSGCVGLREVTEQEREELTRWTQSRTLPAGDVFRARLVLALADGRSYSQIEEELGTSRPTIARWKARFEKLGIPGLEPQHKGSQPRTATPAAQARVLRKTNQKPGDGSTHWSCRKMAAAIGLSKSTVQRIWVQARVKPHRLDRYMASNDPQFEEKAADIIGLYMNPPQHAVVFCVDEKTAIQALDRLDPVLPLSPGRAEKHGFDTIVTAHCRCMPPSMSQQVRFWARRRHATPVLSSSTFSRTSWTRHRSTRRSTLCWTTSRPTGRKQSTSTSRRTRE